MQQTKDNTSAEKENKKVDADKATDDNIIREGQADNSIYSDDNNKSTYPYKYAEDKQLKEQEEYIDRNGETKDKS